MNSPYKYLLDDLAEKNLPQDIVITRADAPDLIGKISEIAEGGVTIVSPHKSHPDAGLFTFVAYGDIRGVGYVDWDLSEG